MPLRSLIDLFLLAALWGASFLFMRATAPLFGPIALITLRVCIASLFLLPLLLMQGGGSALRQHPFRLLLAGLINTAIPFVLLAYATLSLTAGFAAVLNATAPMWGALLGYLLWQEPLARSRLLGLLVGFSGVALLVWDKVSFKPGGSGLAVVAGLAATFCYGLASHLVKRQLAGVRPLAVACGSQLGAALCLLPLALWQWPAVHASTAQWGQVVMLGVGCTGIAYILYFRLLSQVGVARALAVTYLIPLFGILWGYLLLHETVTLRMLLGGLVILLGVALATGVLPRARPASPR
ncbi:MULTISPECIES: DMT family transporter [Leeia]|uniref:DMT family transporter n=1 Tax=Leeia aquatica TaxID=2725557 RepID=A0A847S8E3_9NEIS|nr:DMT family transporter [Leeia aquatica]NLR76234.1 DMT family transporter [Leeia aquatica]